MLTVNRRHSIHKQFQATRDRQICRAWRVERHDKTGRQHRSARWVLAITGLRKPTCTGRMIKKCSLAVIGKVSAPASRIQVLETANDSRTTKYIEALIIDPDSEDACKFYASFGHANRVKGRNIRSVRDVRLELLTTTLVCLRINSSPFINFELSVTNKVAISRLDISDSALIMTKPYPGDPALHFPKDTFFYASYKEEFNIAKQQGRKINMEASKIDISSENIKEILFEAGFDVSYFDVDFERDLLHALNNIEKPY